MVIMNLVTAHDETFGHVPGTLDYMPPEVVLADNRGGPGMDIYALGLSFYEALSGKTAYPRLPVGNVGFVAFINRAKNKEPPSFDSSIVAARLKLLQLLKDMTNIDPEQRIKDATEVERRIGELLSEERCWAIRRQR